MICSILDPRAILISLLNKGCLWFVENVLAPAQYPFLFLEDDYFLRGKLHFFPWKNFHTSCDFQLFICGFHQTEIILQKYMEDFLWELCVERFSYKDISPHKCDSGGNVFSEGCILLSGRPPSEFWKFPSLFVGGGLWKLRYSMPHTHTHQS